ncbi:MAG: hypothetical protein PHU46_10520 [Rhodocyclaceae bacterium]|nr:hypothetical protein [Rhodocyclaceae bacterium]
MDKLGRLYELRQLLSTRRAVPTAELQEHLGVSRATTPSGYRLGYSRAMIRTPFRVAGAPGEPVHRK